MSLVRAKVADGRLIGTLTRDDIVEALKLYGELYGPDFAQSAFNPSSAKRNGRPDLVERYYEGRPDGRPWPSLNAIKSKFDGSWNAARKAAGFKPNSTGPARGRRKPGEAEPILNVRERLVYVPDAKVKAVTHRAKLTEEKLARALRRTTELENELRELKRRPAPVAVTTLTQPPKTVTKTKTITKKVKVKDTRAERRLERLEARLADTEAALRAAQDQLRAEQAEHSRSEAKIASALSEASESRSAAKEAIRSRDRAVDRLSASEALTERLRDELEEARGQAMGATEAAAASELVQRAEMRANLAEIRAARAEREMAEQASAITGELRKLTTAELAELRAKGPAGPAVLAQALTKLKRARAFGGKDSLRSALNELARAAATWEARL